MRHLILVAILAIPLAASAGEPLTLVQDGKSAYSIVISSEASASEKRGAVEFASHIKRMSGATLRIITDQTPLPPAAILVGRSKHAIAQGLRLDLAALGNEGFVIKTAGPHVIIAGSRVRGTMYGCTAFLERLGVRWFTPKVTSAPSRPTITIDEINEQQIPAFEYREPYFTEAMEKEWAARLRINGSSTGLDHGTGGKVVYYPFVHSFDQLVPPELFETHPEYFPLIKGKRTGGYVQRCLTNPDVLKLTIQKVDGWLREHPEVQICSVSQNDTGNWCECEACMAIVGKHAAHSGLYLWFVNQVAASIARSHPDKLIDTLAYQFTEIPPKDIVPRKNVRVRLCPIAVCEAHPYEKCSDPHSVDFVKHLKDWAAITDTLYIWHYNIDFAHYLMPFPDFDEFPADIRLYQRAAVKGIFFEGDYAPGGGGADAELRSYVMAKLLWEPALDSDALVNEWMAGVYGPAAPPMRKWFDLLHAAARDPARHLFIYAPPANHFLTGDILKQGDELFDQAEKLAAGNAEALHYIAKSRLCLRYVKLTRAPTTGVELTNFLADARKLGITQIAEGKSVDKWEKEYRQAATRPAKK